MPCEVDITGYSSMIPVRSERIYSIQSALKCARRELKLYIFTEVYTFTFTFMHLADAFIQSDLQCIQVIHFLCVFPGNRTHNLCAANAML